MTFLSASVFYEKVIDDIEELKVEYPVFSYEIPQLSEEVLPVEIKALAVNRALIERARAAENDFTGDFSKVIRIVVPVDYMQQGCRIYGGSWIDVSSLLIKDCHFYSDKNGKRFFCVGIPDSFPQLKNVILENVRTVEYMLSGYEFFQRGLSKRVGFKAYSHGLLGRFEYKNDVQRFENK